MYLLYMYLPHMWGFQNKSINQSIQSYICVLKAALNAKIYIIIDIIQYSAKCGGI